MRFLFCCIWVFVIAGSFQSCEYFGNNRVSKEAIVKEELESIDWNTVDGYPSFSSCENLSEVEAKHCFENTLTSFFYEALSNHPIKVSKSINDTVFVELLIDSDGTIKFLQAIKSDLVMEQIPDFDTIIQRSMESVPKAFPANKRATPVATKFKLPILLVVE